MPLEVLGHIAAPAVGVLDRDVEHLGQALGAGGPPPGPSIVPAIPGNLVARDEQTGQPYLRLPMPGPDTVQKIVELFAALTGQR